MMATSTMLKTPGMGRVRLSGPKWKKGLTASRRVALVVVVVVVVVSDEELLLADPVEVSAIGDDSASVVFDDD